MQDDERKGWSAAALRREIEDRQRAAAAEHEAAVSAQERARRAFADDFMLHHLGPEELGHIRATVEAAVRRGELSALVYRFPSALCTDDGRAINNTLPGWEETLQGKALDFYRDWERHLKPQGFHLHAEIVDFPGGIPGDVGLILSWAGRWGSAEG